MCGIAGFFLKKDDNSLKDNSIEIINNMLGEIDHRGPDRTGIWRSPNSSVVFGHKRLSILELSNAGNQPMFDASENLILIFNGEIYNHLQLRKEIINSGKRVHWKGGSDTETLIESIKVFGLEKTLQTIEGMFSFALFDKRKSKLYLVRDRIGEKPLYYSCFGNRLIFGSELKALLKFPIFDRSINKSALENFLNHNYVKGPYSIYNNTFKLQPGTLLVFDTEKLKIEFQCFWDLHENLKESVKNKFTINEDDIVDEIHEELKSVVRDQSVADVNIGSFLSGGLDSSLITALMQSQVGNTINTFSIGFQESSYDESEYSMEVSKRLGTNHTYYNFTKSDAQDLIPKLPKIYDEPFADSSQLPTLFLSFIASKSNKVCLSGDGGDELFCGYSRYSYSRNISNVVLQMPLKFRDYTASLLNTTNNILNRHSLKGKKIIQILRSKDFYDLYQQFITLWPNKNIIIKNNLKDDKCPQLTYCHDQFKSLIKDDFNDDFLLQAMESDIFSYLVDDIMVKVDRASMSFSLETRAPFLNHRLLKKAFMIPRNLRCKNNEQKYILRRIISRYLPIDLFDRPKAGFSVPLDSWLRGPLREWAEELLDPSLIKEQGFFDNRIIEKVWQKHKQGNRRYHYYLWDILMFQSWFNYNYSK